jgi:alkylation response protein AidB-like acyl-CoA dehydrogenase
MSLDSPAFALSEEHEALREAVRALADDKIAPRAADIDRTAEFPWDVYEALVKADFQAVHLPEAAARSDRAMAGEQVDDLTFFSSACKCLASDVAMSVTTDAVQLLGGYGYVNDYPVERMMRDAKITQIYEGTNQIQRVVLARHLLR